MKASAQSTSHGGWAERNPAGAVTCGLLLSLILSCWLARERVGGGRGWCGGEAILFGRSAGIFTSRQQEVRERQRSSLQSRLTHVHLAKCWAAVLQLQTPCVWEGREAAVNSTEAAHLRLSLQLHAWLGCLTSLCFDNTCWRQRPPRDVHTVSQVYQTMPEWLGTRERRSSTALALEEQTGVPGVQIPIRLSKMTTMMTRKRLLCFPVFNYSGPSKVTSLSTACNRGSLLLRRLAQDKGQSY